MTNTQAENAEVKAVVEPAEQTAAEKPVSQAAASQPAPAENRGYNNNNRRSFNGNRRPGGDRNGRPRRGRDQDKEFEDRVVKINRITKVVKGGRRMRFAALVVVGDKKGRVGFGTGKAKEVPDAIKKATEKAEHNITKVNLVGTTLPHDFVGEYGAGRVVLRPAAEGTGVIAGGPVRAVLELAGVKDVISKCIGTRTPINAVRATLDALEEMKTLEQVSALRGKKPSEIRH